MRGTDGVSNHYTHGSLLKAIHGGVERLGKTPDMATVEDRGPVDEFHIGGRRASESLLEQLNLSQDDHVLDVGCGLGALRVLLLNASAATSPVSTLRWDISRPVVSCVPGSGSIT